MEPLEYYVTPITPYLICDHFISTEIHPSEKYIGMPLSLTAIDLLKEKSFSKIQSMDIIQIQVDYFDFFYDKILPILCERNIKVIIFTSQWHLPQLHRSNKTDLCLEHPNILLWISQNPIYKHEKYMAFPYGICQQSIKAYAEFVESNPPVKENIVANLHASVHTHLPPQHIRNQYELFGKKSGPILTYTDYLTQLAKSQFVISTSGDRDDCYRHYECIGLNAIPVSNITGYEEIFGTNMVYSNAEEMVKMVHSNTVGTYVPPDKSLLTIAYWVSEINRRSIKLNIILHIFV